MRASLYLIGFAAASILGAGAAEIGCSSSSSGGTTPTPPEDASTPVDTGTTPPEDSGTTPPSDAGAGPCTPVTDASAATIVTGSPVWDCYESKCATSLTACAADCNCNNEVIESLLCTADGGNSTTCFGLVTGVTTPPQSDLTTCIVTNAVCQNATAGDGGTEAGTPSEAGVDGGDGG
jgi:hypothetical protein